MASVVGAIGGRQNNFREQRFHSTFGSSDYSSNNRYIQNGGNASTKQSATQNGRHSNGPQQPKVARKQKERCSSDLSIQSLNRRTTPTDDDSQLLAKESDFNEEDYLAGRIFTGLVANRLIVKNRPISLDFTNRNGSLRYLRSSSVSRVQDIAFKPQDPCRSTCGTRGNGSAASHNYGGIHLQQKTGNKATSELGHVPSNNTTVKTERTGLNQKYQTGYTTSSMPITSVERSERGQLDQHPSLINQRKPERADTSVSSGRHQSTETTNTNGRRCNSEMQRSQGRQIVRSHRSSESNEEYGNRKHQKQLEENPDLPHEIHTMDKTGNANKRLKDAEEEEDLDKVYDYFVYIGTRIPSKSFSKLSRSINRQAIFQP